MMIFAIFAGLFAAITFFAACLGHEAIVERDGGGAFCCLGLFAISAALFLLAIKEVFNS